MDDTEETDDDSHPMALLLVVPVVLAWIGLPTVIFSVLWLYALVLVQGLTGLPVPSGSLGFAAAVGAPETVNGVSTLLVTGAGLASTTVWFALFGGGDAPGKFGSRSRDERRFEF